MDSGVTLPDSRHHGVPGALDISTVAADTSASLSGQTVGHSTREYSLELSCQLIFMTRDSHLHDKAHLVL